VVDQLKFQTMQLSSVSKGAPQFDNIIPDQEQEIVGLRERAVRLCSIGDDLAGVDVTAQIRAILNID
jgi:hypothetical protein